MVDERRTHRRIKKTITLHFCLGEGAPQKWDMSVIEDISVGGIKFKARSDQIQIGKTIHLRIRVPELAPFVLNIEALVLNIQKPFIRVKFINLSEEYKKYLDFVLNLDAW